MFSSCDFFNCCSTIWLWSSDRWNLEQTFDKMQQMMYCMFWSLLDFLVRKFPVYFTSWQLSFSSLKTPSIQLSKSTMNSDLAVVWALEVLCGWIVNTWLFNYFVFSCLSLIKTHQFLIIFISFCIYITIDLQTGFFFVLFFFKGRGSKNWIATTKQNVSFVCLICKTEVWGTGSFGKRRICLCLQGKMSHYIPWSGYQNGKCFLRTSFNGCCAFVKLQ